MPLAPRILPDTTFRPISIYTINDNFNEILINNDLNKTMPSFYIWRPPSLSELTPMIFNTGLSHLGL